MREFLRMKREELHRHLLFLWSKIEPISPTLIVVAVYVPSSIVSQGRLAPPSDFFGLPGWAFGIGVLALAQLAYFLRRRMVLKNESDD